MSDGQNESCSGPEVGFEKIAVDLLQARFWRVIGTCPVTLLTGT